LYVEAQAQVFAFKVSPPKVKNLLLYDHAVKAFIDDEALE
jgi:hypothetical protein